MFKTSGEWGESRLHGGDIEVKNIVSICWQFAALGSQWVITEASS